MLAINRRSLLRLAGTAGLVATVGAGARAGEPTQGGTLVVGINDETKTLDPTYSVQFSERQVLYLLYDTFLRMQPDFSVAPGLAKSWRMENGGSRVVFTVQEGVMFHDGTALDAQAVKWNIDRRLDEKIASPQRSQLRPQIASVEVVGPLDVAFNLNGPRPGLLSDLADRAGCMVSPTAAEKYGQDFGRHPVGTGPLVLSEWTQGTSIKLSRNPNYWVKGRPYLDGVTFRSIPNALIGIQRLIVGEIDFVGNLTPDLIGRLDGQHGIDVQEAPIGRWFTLQYQVDKPPFDNVKLRQAIAYALDRNRINQIVMGGKATLANGPTPAGLWWSSPDHIVYDYDPAKAKSLLKEAGISEGTPITLSAPSDPVMLRIDQLVEEQLDAVGLKVKLAPVANSESYARVVQRAINFTPITWTQRGDPDGLFYILFSSRGFANSTGYHNPDVDKLLESGRTTMDQSVRKQIYAEVKDHLMQDLPYIPLFFSAEYVAMSSKLGGYIGMPDEIPRFAGMWKSA
jgi:peptide/nickel transport system substrate-binding protein